MAKPVKCNDGTMDYNGTKCVNNGGIKLGLPSDSSGTPSDDPDGDGRNSYGQIAEVQLGKTYPSVSQMGTPGSTPRPITLSRKEVVEYWNKQNAKKNSPIASERAEWNKFNNALKKRGNIAFKSDTGSLAAWEELVTTAGVSDKDVLDLLYNPTYGGNGDGDGDGKKYTGPVQTNTISTMDDRDVEITLNEFATEMLGRNLTKKELDKYSNKFKKQDLQAQTNLRVPNGPGEVTSMTQEKPSRENMAKDIVRSNDDYVTNTINTDVYEIMARRLGL